MNKTSSDTNSTTTHRIEINDPRDTLWQWNFELFYDSSFEQLVIVELLRRWHVVDVVCRLLVAVTASGSAIAAWTVWNVHGVNWLWAIVAGAAALFSIVHTVINVASRMKELADSRIAFLLIRIETDRLRYRMEIDPQFSISEITTSIEKLSSDFSLALSKQTVDILRTQSVELAIQDELDRKIDFLIGG